jgi:Ca2+-binding EF-hand superfamily protein
MTEEQTPKSVMTDYLSSEENSKTLCREAFNYVDSDENGQINCNEFQIAIGRVAFDCGFPELSKEQCVAIFENLDEDQTFKIRFSVFHNYVRELIASMLAVQSEV